MVKTSTTQSTSSIPCELAEQIKQLTTAQQQLTEAVKNQQQINTTQANLNPEANTTYQHTVDSTIRAVPEQFTLGTPNVMDGWRVWTRGNSRCGANQNEPIRPYKDIPCASLDGDAWKKERKKYSQWNVVYRYLAERWI